MKPVKRVLLVAGAPLVFAGSFWFAWIVMPHVRQCLSIFCGANFDPGGLNVFGEQILTPLQTFVIAAGIVAAAFMLTLGVLPRGLLWTAVGVSLLVLAGAIAFALPSPTIGLAPTVPCSTPGLSGPVHGDCAIGSAPVDRRIGDRALILAGGLVALGFGVAADRRRRSHRGEVARVGV